MSERPSSPDSPEGLSGRSGGDELTTECLLDVIDAFYDGDVGAEELLASKLASASGATALVGCDLCRSKFTLTKEGAVRPWPPGCQKPEESLAAD